MRVFEVLLKHSEVSLSVFQFFGNELFSEFITNIHNFLFEISDTIIEKYPSEKSLLITILNESCENMQDFILEHFSSE